MAYINQAVMSPARKQACWLIRSTTHAASREGVVSTADRLGPLSRPLKYCVLLTVDVKDRLLVNGIRGK